MARSKPKNQEEEDIQDEVDDDEIEDEEEEVEELPKSAPSSSMKKKVRSSQENKILDDFGSSHSKSSSSVSGGSPKGTFRTKTQEVTTISRKTETVTVGAYEGETLNAGEGEEVLLGSPHFQSPRRRTWISENNIIRRSFRQLIQNWQTILGYIVAGLVIGAIFYVFIKHNTEDVPLTSSKVTTPGPGISWTDGQQQFQNSLRQLSKRYPSQPKNSWIQIYSAITSTMTKEKPRQPSSIVFLTHPSVTPDFASCLSHDIGVQAHSVFYNVTGSQYTNKIREINKSYLTSKGTITEIHDDLKTYLNNGKVVIVQDIENINQPDLLYVFHAFCDNSAAPDKRATFIFIVPVPESIFDQFEWKEENAALMSQQILDAAWTSLTPDKRPALIARVAASVVLIEPGDKCSRGVNTGTTAGSSSQGTKATTTGHDNKQKEL